MVRFTHIIVVLSLFIFETSCVPIVKTSGVQWSEPKGAGRGNITILMIPQNTCNNDSDMIVAVKSDFQILSQDTQILNLVIKENGENKSDARGNICSHNNTYRHSKDFNDSEEFVKKDNNFVVKYFEPENKLPGQVVNISVVNPVITPIKNKDYSNASNNSENNGIIKMYKFFNVSNLNQVDVYPNQYRRNKAVSENVGFHQDNITKTELKMQNNYIKNKINDKHNVTVVISKNDSTIREAIDILKIVNHDATLSSKTNHSKEEGKGYVNRKGDAKSNVLISKFAEDEMLEKDFKHFDENGNNLAQIEVNSQNEHSLRTTCLPFFISFSNEQQTVQSEITGPYELEGSSFKKAESRIEVQNMAIKNSSGIENCTEKSWSENENKVFEHISQMFTVSNHFGAGDGDLTGSLVFATSHQECITPQETTQNVLINNTTLDSFGSTISELITESNTLKYVNLESINPKESNVKLMNTPSTVCNVSSDNGSLTSFLANKKVDPSLGGETTVNAEYKVSSGSVLEGNAPTIEQMTFKTPINCETKVDIEIKGQRTITPRYEITTGIFLEGKRPIPKKVTQEPSINCETKVGINIGEDGTKSENKITTNLFLEGNSPMPKKKITLEPSINCESVVSNTSKKSNLKNSPGISQHINENLTFPLVESSVVLATNDEMSKGKDISISLNSSLDQFPWSDLQDRGETSNGRMCDLLNSNAMSLNGEQEFQQDPSSLSHTDSKQNMFSDKNGIDQQSTKNDEKHYYKNDIYNTSFDGNNFIEQDTQKLKLEKNYTGCDSNNQKISVEIMNHENTMNPNSDSDILIRSSQSSKEETQVTMHSILKSSTLFHDEEILTLFDKKTIPPTKSLIQIYNKSVTPQANFNKEWTLGTYTISSSSKYFNEEPAKSEFTFPDNFSVIQSHSFVTSHKCYNTFQTRQPSYNNLRIEFLHNTQLPRPTKIGLPTTQSISCKRKKIQTPSEQRSSKEKIELPGDSVQEIIIKLVKNTNSSNTKQIKTKQPQYKTFKNTCNNTILQSKPPVWTQDSPKTIPFKQHIPFITEKLPNNPVPQIQFTHPNQKTQSENIQKSQTSVGENRLWKETNLLRKFSKPSEKLQNPRKRVGANILKLVMAEKSDKNSV